MVKFDLPKKNISHLVNRYYDVKLENSSTFAQNRMISLSIGHVNFMLHGSSRIETVKGAYKSLEHYLSGMHYPLFSFEHEGPLHFCGIALKPSASFKLFGIHIGELKNRSVNLVDIVGKEAPRTLKELRSVVSWPERLEILSQWIKKQARDIPFNYDHIDLMIDQIYEAEGLITVGQLCERSKVSRRYIEKRFKAMLNLTPGRFIRHVRLHFVCSKIARGETPANDIIENYGYYNRSHFMKAFKKHINKDLSVLSNGQDNLFKEVYKQIHQTDSEKRHHP